jgi:lysophospholipase L1-like esterase
VVWNRVMVHCGLSWPHRPERVLAVLTAVAFGTVVAATATGFVLAGELDRHTPRELYFLYLAGLIVLGFALARWPRLAVPVLALAMVDFCLGIGSHVLRKLDLADSSILPANYNPASGFTWHPLLQGTPIPSLKGGATGLTITHSSEGTRGRDYTEEELRAKTVVATFGGSTTYDIGVSDNDTWSARLEEALGENAYAVINHGVLGYSTVENLIQTAFYQDKFGIAPACALYYVGWNDLRSAHFSRRDSGYARYHLPSQIDSLKVRRIGTGYVSTSPVFTILARLISLWADTARPSAMPRGEPRSGSDSALEALFVRNVRAISAINRDRGIRTIWVGQVLNVQALEGDEVDGWLPLVRDKDVWPLQQRFNELLQATAFKVGDAYIHVPVEDFEAEDFRDRGHFSASGSDKFARSLATAVKRECR